MVVKLSALSSQMESKWKNEDVLRHFLVLRCLHSFPIIHEPRWFWRFCLHTFVYRFSFACSYMSTKWLCALLVAVDTHLWGARILAKACHGPCKLTSCTFWEIHECIETACIYVHWLCVPVMSYTYADIIVYSLITIAKPQNKTQRNKH